MHDPRDVPSKIDKVCCRVEVLTADLALLPSKSARTAAVPTGIPGATSRTSGSMSMSSILDGNVACMVQAKLGNKGHHGHDFSNCNSHSLDPSLTQAILSRVLISPI